MRRAARPALPTRALLVALAALAVLPACGERTTANTRPSLVHRRTDVPFVGHEKPDGSTLEASRKIDELEKLFDEGLTTQASERLAAYFAEGGEHPQAFVLQGRLHEQQGRPTEAFAAYDQAIARSPRWVEPRLLLAQGFLKAMRPAAAEGVFAEIDRLFPKGPWGPYGMGLVAWQRGDSARAATLLDEALGRDPKHAPSLRTRAELARMTGGPQEEDLLSRYLAEEPYSASAHFRLAEIALAADRPRDARRHFVTSYELEPTVATARRLAEMAATRGDAADARRWQKRAGIEPQPGQPQGPIP